MSVPAVSASVAARLASFAIFRTSGVDGSSATFCISGIGATFGNAGIAGTSALTFCKWAACASVTVALTLGGCSMTFTMSGAVISSLSFAAGSVYATLGVIVRNKTETSTSAT